jgi:hypothetical protein
MDTLSLTMVGSNGVWMLEIQCNISMKTVDRCIRLWIGAYGCGLMDKAVDTQEIIHVVYNQPFDVTSQGRSTDYLSWRASGK